MKTESIKPTHRMVAALFRQLTGWGREELDPRYVKYRDLDEKLEALKEKLLANPRYKALEKKRDAAYHVHYHQKRILMQKAAALYKIYLANGITSEVISGLNKLVRAKMLKE